MNCWMALCSNRENDFPWLASKTQNGHLSHPALCEVGWSPPLRTSSDLPLQILDLYLVPSVYTWTPKAHYVTILTQQVQLPLLSWSYLGCVSIQQTALLCTSPVTFDRSGNESFQQRSRLDAPVDPGGTPGTVPKARPRPAIGGWEDRGSALSPARERWITDIALKGWRPPGFVVRI